MRLSYLVVIATLVAAQFSQAQAQEGRREDREVARACKADAEKLCSGKTGEEARQCLQSNSAKLSSECKTAVSKLPAPKS
jgi:hypothetical protein